MRTSQKIITVIAVLSSIAIFGFSRQGTSETAQPNKLVVANTATNNPVVSSAAVLEPKNDVAPATSSGRGPKNEASCENPVVTTTEPISVELKNQALVEGMEAFDQFQEDHGVVATPEEREAYVKQLAEVLATEIVTENVYVDEAETPGVITDSEANPSDAQAEKIKNKAKRGCKGKNRVGSAQLVAFSTVAYDNSVGWKSCSKTVSFKAYNGLTIGKLRLVSEWYNTVYQVPVPDMIEGRATGNAYYLWSTDGEERLSIGRKWARYPNNGAWHTYQNRAWQDFVYKISVGIGGVGGSVTLDSHQLYTEHKFGPGGKCV